MSLFVFNNSQELIKSIPDENLVSLQQEQEINKTDSLLAVVPVKIWDTLKEKAFYLAVQDPYERYSYHMYKVSNETTMTDTVDIQAVQLGFDELKAYGYIQDRRFDNSSARVAAEAVVEGTDWQIGFVDSDLPTMSENYYYISRLEALSTLLEAVGAEVQFRVEISGNKIIAKRINIYQQLGEFKGKRFSYGGKLLEVTKEENNAEIFTALVGRGKGEETTDENGQATGGHGRRITFEGVEWSASGGDPIDKPLGQEYVELIEMTALYGYSDGTARTGIVEFTETEEPEKLLSETYETLINVSRPQVEFKATVETAGDMQLGERVAIIRPDLDFRYFTRVFKVTRDLLNNRYTEATLGDKLTRSPGDLVNKINTDLQESETVTEQRIQTAANGKNKIFRGESRPESGMMVGDLWYRPLENGEKDLYQWNGEAWEILVTTGMNTETKEAIEEAEKLAEKASKNASDASDRVQTAIDDAEEAYKYADSAIRAANGKNTVYRGTDKPTEGEENDIWFEYRVDNGKPVTRMHIHDGKDYQLRANDAASLGGTLDLAELNVINLNMDSATGGTLHLDRGITVENNGKDVLRVENGNVVMEVDNLLIESEDIDDKIGTAIYQDNQAVGLIYEDENGEVKSLINVGKEGPYLAGKNIVLDGDTIVDGNFTVTDEIFAENMSIDKFTAGTLNAAEVNLINVNVDSLVGNYGNFINLLLESASSFTSIDGNGIRATHNDGTYTQLTDEGMRRYTSSDNRNYHYLIHATTFVYGDSSSNARWIQLPNDFKGKNFQVYLAVADSLNAINYRRAIQRIVATGHPSHGIDYANARVPIIAYKSETLSDGVAPEITDVQGMLLAIY